MKKMTRNGLREYRRRVKRKPAAAAAVFVGMGTCGIAAGARDVFDALRDEIGRAGLPSAEVKPTGCLGLCFSEPTVEVRVRGMPDIVYGRIDAEAARRIVQEHLVRRRLLDDHVFDKPAPDRLPESG